MSDEGRDAGGHELLADEARRRRQAALSGQAEDEEGVRRFLADPSPRVRATALGALSRLGRVTKDDVLAALADPDPLLRRRGCEVARSVAGADLLPVLSDPDSSVVEAAAWALGEREAATAGTVPALASVATGHPDPLCREAAVAALGAIGDQAGLPAILAAATDKPAVRRRAVIALAPFEGPAVDAALQRALSDRDWQVRQAAEDLAADGDRAR